MHTAVLASAATSLVLLDSHAGTQLASWKQAGAAAHATAVVATRNGLGGVALAVQPDKPLLHVFSFQKDQMHLKMVLPEKLTCLAVDKQGKYCAAGTANGRLYFWELASGILFNTFDAHYRKVNVVRFTDDGAALVSGSEDSGIAVWALARLLDNASQTDAPTAFCTLTDHTLAITDILCGVGSFPACRIFSTSLDSSIKIWDLATRSLLTTVQMPYPLTLLAIDPSERTIFAASSADVGSVYQVNLFRCRDSRLGRVPFEAVAGGLSDIVHVTDENQRLISVGQSVTALALDMAATALLVGTASGVINVYDIASHQLLHTISAATHKGYPITFLATMLRPPDLISHIAFRDAASSAEAMPVLPVAPFQRVRDAKTREAHELSMMLPPVNVRATGPSAIYGWDQIMRDHRQFVEPRNGSTQSSQAQVEQLSNEVARLRDQLGRVKGMNDAMWEAVVHTVLSSEDGSVATAGA